MTRLYIVRHGETEWNREKRTQGCSNDYSLSQEGKLQAIAAAKRFKDLHLDTIYSSDLKRAFETAQEISKAVSVPVNISEGLREMNFGCWEGLTFDEIMIKYADIYKVWSTKPKETIIPQGETLVMLQERVIHAVNDILLKHKGENILIVSHGISIKVLILSILGMDISHHSRIRIDNASINIIDYKEKYPALTLLNDVCHLV